MSTRTLPVRPNLEQLKRQAQELLRDHRDGQAAAAARILAHHPERRNSSVQAILDAPLTLADAQLVLAREYGFANWSQIKHRVELIDRIGTVERHPQFAEALAALDAGDVPRLRGLLVADPSLLQARTNLDPPYGYFTGATLLHHVAGNPGRDNRLPPNIVEIARLLLEQGADANARTLGPSPSNSPLSEGSTTLGLVVTSKQASDMNVSGPLIDLLVKHGAPLDLGEDDVLDGSLTNHAPRAAERLIELGARADLYAAAALGRMDLLARLFDADGRLLERPKRNGKEVDERHAVGLALLYAYVRNEREAVNFLLEKNGDWDVIGVNNGTVLHRAAWAGDLDMVQRLVAKGADVNNRDNPFHSTPLAWADYNKKHEVAAWLQQHAAIDVHDASAFDLRERLETILREDPRAVRRQIHFDDLPQSTPLHAAACFDHAWAAVRLIEAGADPNALAGNGMTPLDVADACKAGAAAAAIAERGGTRLRAVTNPRGRAKRELFEQLAADIREGYQSGSPEAMGRIRDVFGFGRDIRWEELRERVSGSLAGQPDEESRSANLSLDDARLFVAHLYGMKDWESFTQQLEQPAPPPQAAPSVPGTTSPFFKIDVAAKSLTLRGPILKKDWDTIAHIVKEHGLTRLDAGGQMTDAGLERLAVLGGVTTLNVGSSNRLTDDGLLHLERMPQLQDLELGGWHSPITDRGLNVLRHLTNLKRIQACWSRHISDAGVRNLAACERIESVDLMGTPTGDGALVALAGKPGLRRFKTGKDVTDAGLALLQRFPVFKTWRGGEIKYSLMSADAAPNHLLLDGPFTNHGLASLAGLDGLFGLTFFWHITGMTPEGLAPLRDMANLGFLGCQDALCNDVAMQHIAAIPRLRMLMGQGAIAGDNGFTSLSKSKTIEYIWGRDCPNFGGRAFMALAAMPALRGVAISCKRVDDQSLSVLPQFPALRAFMPMDVPDAGFRHVGRCAELEELWCMYCRDTGDVATEHIAGLSRLRSYYAGASQITDRSLEMLARMTPLERIEFYQCARITDAGVRLLAALPRLREVILGGSLNVSREVASAFPDRVRVDV